MATYSRREVHTRRVEYIVPAEYPLGACWVEVYKAVSAAHQELQSGGVLAEGEAATDDQIRIVPADNEIIVAFQFPEVKS